MNNILQASCLPVFISGAKPGMNAIDSCSAPGNKTTYLAAVMENKGYVFLKSKCNFIFSLLTDLY